LVTIEYVPDVVSVIVPDITSSLNPPVSEKMAAGNGAELTVEIEYDPSGVFCVVPPGPVGDESLPHPASKTDAATAHSATSVRPGPNDAFLAT
jgi:hypothetical protein